MRAILIMLGLVGSLTTQAQICKISIEGLRNDVGDVKITVYKGEEGFPEGTEFAYSKEIVPIKDKKAQFELELPEGKYAVAMLHDEDLDKKMNYSWLGIPQEGFGFSNNPKITISAPKYEECAFVVTDKGCEVTLKVIYF